MTDKNTKPLTKSQAKHLAHLIENGPVTFTDFKADRKGYRYNSLLTLACNGHIQMIDLADNVTRFAVKIAPVLITGTQLGLFA